MTTTLESPPSATNETDAAVAAHDAGGRPVLFFDGVCGFCNASVNWMLSHDTRGELRFAPLQGETAKQLLPAADSQDLNSVVLRDERGLHRRSRAIVRALHHLGGRNRFYSWLLWVIPVPLRDIGYRLVAKLRYRVTGKTESCRLPTAAERERFLP